MRIIKQEFADNTCQFMERVSAFCLEFDEREQQVIDHGGPDLCHDSIFCGAEERFDSEILFNPFEEDFDLPAGFIHFRDGAGSQSEVVSHEANGFSGVRIDNGHEAELSRIIPALVVI